MSLDREETKSKIFLCYPGSDSDITGWREGLEGLGFDVFPREELILPGTSWTHSLRRQLASVELCIVLVPAEEMAWESYLLQHFAKVIKDGSGLILPVVSKSSRKSFLPDMLRDVRATVVRGFFFRRPNSEDVASVATAARTLLAHRNRSDESLSGGQGYVAEVKLQSFQAFRDAQVARMHLPGDSISRWNVILGDNGTGKTTFLRAIAACCAGGPSVWRARASQCSMQVSRSLDKAETYIVAGPNGEFDDLRPFCIGYGAGRMTLPSKRSANTIGATATLFADDVDLPDPENWFLQIDHSLRVRDDAATKRHFARVKAALIKLLPDVTDIKVETDGSRTRVNVQMHGEWFPMSAMSLGYRTALTWMIDLAQKMFERYPNSPEPLQEPVVVLIDEIDLHLHPRWQRSLLEVLDTTFTKAQFIVTAHSPLIVQAAPNANLVLLRRKDGHIVVDNDKDEIRNWRIDQMLASDLFGNQPVYSPHVQKLLDERRQLKSPADDKRLAEIDAELKQQPTAALPEDQAAMDVVRKAAEFLRNKKSA